MSTETRTVISADPGATLSAGVPQAVVFGQSMVRFRHIESKNMYMDIHGDDAAQMLKRLRAFEEVVRDTIMFLEGGGK